MPYKDPEKRRRWRKAYEETHRELLNEKQRAWSSKHREELADWQRGYRRTNKMRMRDANLRRDYGISLNEFAEIEERQGGVCAICGGPPNGRGVLYVDHDHANGEIRGLLCGKCNAGLGMFRDSPSLMRSAAEYVELKSKERTNDERGTPRILRFG